MPTMLLPKLNDPCNLSCDGVYKISELFTDLRYKNYEDEPIVDISLSLRCNECNAQIIHELSEIEDSFVRAETLIEALNIEE